jgi:multiple sugar transport system permease protein
MRALVAISATLAALFCVAPFAWLVLAGLHTAGDPLTGAPTAENLVRVLRDQPIPRALLNSLVVAGTTTLVALVLGTIAAFALARLRPPGKGLVLAAVLAISMFPPIATVGPLYVILRALGLLDRPLGLVVPYATFALPLAIWLLVRTFEEIPDELDRAAKIDGCGPIQTLLRVHLPLAAPGLATAGLLVFVAAWNELLFALTFVSTPERRPVPVAIALFAAEHEEPWGEIAAASALATVPLVVLALIFQRRIVAGLTAGAVKG